MATRSRKEASVTRHTYEIRVIGSFGPDAREEFADTIVQMEPSITVLSGEFDQRGLHALLDRVRAGPGTRRCQAGSTVGLRQTCRKARASADFVVQPGQRH